MATSPGQDEEECKMGRGATLRTQSRILVKRLYEYFSKERENKGALVSLGQVNQRVADALQINKNTVSRIVHKPIEQIKTPGKKRPRPSPKSNIKVFNQSEFRNHIYGYYNRKELPTRKKLFASLKEEGLFIGGITTLSGVLNNVGFKSKKINNRIFIIEKYEIINWRCDFLRKIMTKDINKLVFLDETSITTTVQTFCQGWSDDSVKWSKKEPIDRIVIGHAGTTQGFVSDGFFLLKPKKEDNQDINVSIFINWFTKLVKNIPPGSTIIMDAVSHHSLIIDKSPTSASTKTEIIDWLTSKNINFDPNLRKAELLTIVKNNKITKSDLIDNIAIENNQEVLRIPPYHPQFNPIKSIWAHVKQDISSNSKTNTIAETERLAKESIEKITPEIWKDKISKTIGIIQEAWKNEEIIEDRVEKMIISLRSLPSEYSSDEDENYFIKQEEESD